MGTRVPVSSEMDDSSVARQLRPRSSSACAGLPRSSSDHCLLRQLPSTSKDTLSQQCGCSVCCDTSLPTFQQTTPPIGTAEIVTGVPGVARKRRTLRTRSASTSRKQLFRTEVSADADWDSQWVVDDRLIRPAEEDDDDEEDGDLLKVASSPTGGDSPVDAEASTSTDAANPTTDSVKTKKRKKKVKLGGRHVCRVCSKVFGSPGKLSQHMYAHTGEKPFECLECPKAFSSKFKLVRHHLIHSEERQYRCSMCERTFHRKDHLKNHLKVHSPVKKTYRCDRPYCVKVYSSYLSYRKHTAFHAAEEGDLDCKMCGKNFPSKEAIEYHLKVHSGSRTVKNPSDKKFSCSHCDRKFFTRKDVRRHLVVHTGKRDFLCQFCPQRFGRKDHLVRHIKKSHNVGMNAALRAVSRGKKNLPQSTQVCIEAPSLPMVVPPVVDISLLAGSLGAQQLNSATSPDDVQGTDDLLSSVDSVLSTAPSSSPSNLILDEEGKAYQMVDHIKEERVLSPLTRVNLLEPLPAFKLEEIKEEGVAVSVTELLPVYVPPPVRVPVPDPVYPDQLPFKEEDHTDLDIMSVGQIDAAVKVVPSTMSPLLPNLEENHFISSLTSETATVDNEPMLPAPDFLTQISAEEVIRLLNTADVTANNAPLPRFNQAFQQQPPP